MNDVSELTLRCYTPFLLWNYGNPRKYYEVVEYTGRWKIRVEEGKAGMYLECFSLEDGEKMIKPLGWVHEDDLEVRIIKEYVNTCGE